MIAHHLKNLRLNNQMNLRELAHKVGKSHPQYSRIENGKVLPEDDTIMEILMKGFDFPYSKAKDTLAQWRMEEALSKADNPQAVINSIIAGGDVFNAEGDGRITIKH